MLIVQAASHQVQLTVPILQSWTHTSLRETRVVTRETIGNGTNLVMKAIKSYRNRKAFGPDKLSIFH